MNTNLLTIGAMARRLCVTPQCLRKMAEDGDLPHVKIGEQMLFNGPLVEDILLKMASEMPEDKSAEGL